MRKSPFLFATVGLLQLVWIVGMTVVARAA